MTPEIEIVGGADEYQAAAIVAAIQAVLAEEEARAKRLSTVSRWRPEITTFEPGTWGVPRPDRGSDQPG